MSEAPPEIQPIQPPQRIEAQKPSAFPEQVKAEVKRWTEAGKAWLEKLRGTVETAPKKALEEIQEAPKKEAELLASGNGRPPAEELEETQGPKPEDGDGNGEIEVTKTDQVETLKVVAPKETKITVPPNLEQIGLGSGGSQADVYVDRDNRVAYRVIKWDKLHEYYEKYGQAADDPENARRDFEYKVEVGKRDRSGLTPQIYEYDPQSGVLKMEFIEGVPLTNMRNKLPPNLVHRFFNDLNEYHREGLVHGDLSDFSHYILTSDDRIRLIDPSYVQGLGDLISLEQQQATDQDLAKRVFKDLNIALKLRNL